MLGFDGALPFDILFFLMKIRKDKFCFQAGFKLKHKRVYHTSTGTSVAHKISSYYIRNAWTIQHRKSKIFNLSRTAVCTHLWIPFLPQLVGTLVTVKILSHHSSKCDLGTPGSRGHFLQPNKRAGPHATYLVSGKSKLPSLFQGVPESGRKGRDSAS